MLELRNQHIVHCDVNPSNILVTWVGHIVFADFGILLPPRLGVVRQQQQTF